MVTQHPMLKETYEILKKKASEVKKDLKEIQDKLNQAYESGGQWHDNPHWDYTMEDQRKLINKNQEISRMMSSPLFIEDLDDEIDYKTVTVGTKVKIKEHETGETKEYKIVGSADLMYNPECNQEGYASNRSPIIQPLLGKEVGDVVTFKGREIEILEIERMLEN